MSFLVTEDREGNKGGDASAERLVNLTSLPLFVCFCGKLASRNSGKSAQATFCLLCWSRGEPRL